MSDERMIPLFPLGLVLLPDMPLPLHIFEERYKLMIGECLRAKKEFGVVYHDGTNIMEVGCTAKITHVLNRYNDGRMDILTIGKERFHVDELYEHKPYIEAKVVLFKDSADAVDGKTINLARKGTIQLEELQRLTGKNFNLSLLARLELEHFSFIIAANEEFTAEEKQRFLEMTSTHRRLKESIDSLQIIVQKMKLKKQISKIFSSKNNFSDSTPL